MRIGDMSDDTVLYTDINGVRYWYTAGNFKSVFSGYRYYNDKTTLESLKNKSTNE